MAFLRIEDIIGLTPFQKAQQALNLMQQNASRQRRLNMQKRIDYFQDKQERYLDELLNKTFEDINRLRLQKQYLNITEMIINEKSILYNEPPKRRLEESTDKDTEIYEKIQEGSNIDFVMQEVNKYTNLCKTVLIRPVYRNESIQYDIYTPNMFDIIQNPVDSTEAVAVVWVNIRDYTNQEATFTNTDTKTDNDLFEDSNAIYFYMDHKHFIQFKANSKSKVPLENSMSVLNNPYGILPFVVSRASFPVDNFYIQGGDELINTNEIVNMKKTELNYASKMQGFSIPVRKGAEADKSGVFILDPSMSVDVPADTDTERNADFKFVTPDPKLKELEETIVNNIRQISVKNGISQDRFISSAQKSSSEALQIQAFDQAKVLKKDKIFYSYTEKKLFDMTRIIWNLHRNDKLSDSAKLFIDYVDIEVPMTVEERDQHNLLMFNNGLISKTEWLMEENPDIRTQDQAIKRIEEINQENRAVSETRANDIATPLIEELDIEDEREDIDE